MQISEHEKYLIEFKYNMKAFNFLSQRPDMLSVAIRFYRVYVIRYKIFYRMFCKNCVFFAGILKIFYFTLAQGFGSGLILTGSGSGSNLP